MTSASQPDQPEAVASEPDVLIRVDGRAGRLTMNRPKALNALTLGMVREMHRALEAWMRDPAVTLVILDGTGGRALCAGGDVRSLYDAAPQGSSLARTFWRAEYQLDALIHRYPKPFVAIMDGIVMGGGIGISALAQGGTRIVTERSQLAMPETTIGLVPDVGGTWLLAHAPDAVGNYVGLCGYRMNAADAIYARFADRFVPTDRIADMIAALAGGRQTVGAILDDFGADPGRPALAPVDGGALWSSKYADTPATQEQMSDEMDARYMLESAFSSTSIVAIVDALNQQISGWPRSPAAAWAKARLDELAVRSPLALHATLGAIRRARSLPSLEAALNHEFALSTRLYEHGEFIEGVRALIVDKDKAPKWRPTRLEDVTPDMLSGILAPLPADEALDLRPPA